MVTLKARAVTQARLDALVAFGLACVLALWLTPLAARLATRIGLVDHRSSDRRLHTSPIPFGGGIAMFVAVAVPVLLLQPVAGRARARDPARRLRVRGGRPARRSLRDPPDRQVRRRARGGRHPGRRRGDDRPSDAAAAASTRPRRAAVPGDDALDRRADEQLQLHRRHGRPRGRASARSRPRRSRSSRSRSTAAARRCWRRRWRAPASASCATTSIRRASSWATPARSRSATCWR